MASRLDCDAISLLRRRDPRGFELAYTEYSARLLGFLRRLTGRPELADDLLQHAFLRLAERGSELPPSSDLRAWLFAVARNAYLSELRAARSRPEPAAALEELASPTPDVEARLLLGDVDHALSALRLEDREVLLLIGVEGLAPDTVSRLLGITAAAMRQRLSRARARLLAELERTPERATNEAQRRSSS
jgi:RNA polymerase sigma-70 factor (ECF subfamily)